MKRVLRNLGMLLCAAGMISLINIQNTQAQVARTGIKGGLNISNLYVNDVHDENARLGWHAGFYGQLFASEGFAIQPEINFSTKGTGVTKIDNNSARYEQKFNLMYLDIPVLAVFKLGDVAEVHAGPYWSYLLGASIKNPNNDPNNEFLTVDRDNFDDWDYGLVGGIGFNLGKSAQLGARYNYGLNEIAESAGARRALGNAKNQVAQLYLSFNFNAKDRDDDYRDYSTDY